jgi:Exostosin family
LLGARRLFLREGAPSHLRALFEPDALASAADSDSGEIVVVDDVPWGVVDASVVVDCISRAFAAHPGAKLAVVLWITDSEDIIEWPERVLVWRTSVRKSRLQPCERPLPYVWESAAEPYAPLPRGGRPIVGFCGFANSSPEREALIRAFRHDRRFDTRFILRDSFWGGAPYDPSLIREFEETLRGSHFQVCCRGAGNFSMRFYQTLAAGRIPVLIDSDVALPFPDDIRWAEIVINEPTAESAVETASAWFCRRNLEALQRACASVSARWFTPSAFGKHILAVADEALAAR